jgi:hypothetical protein
MPLDRLPGAGLQAAAEMARAVCAVERFAQERAVAGAHDLRASRIN